MSETIAADKQLSLPNDIYLVVSSPRGCRSNYNLVSIRWHIYTPTWHFRLALNFIMKVLRVIIKMDIIQLMIKFMKVFIMNVCLSLFSLLCTDTDEVPFSNVIYQLYLSRKFCNYECTIKSFVILLLLFLITWLLDFGWMLNTGIFPNDILFSK